MFCSQSKIFRFHFIDYDDLFMFINGICLLSFTYVEYVIYRYVKYKQQIYMLIFIEKLLYSAPPLFYLLLVRLKPLNKHIGPDFPS